MANINELKNYLNHEFSSGCCTGQDYLTFQSIYINYLHRICKDNGWELTTASNNHYCFSAFIKNQGQFVYLSVNDVRFLSNQWYTRILIRTAKHDKDYSGGHNKYSSLPELQAAVERLFKEAEDGRD